MTATFKKGDSVRLLHLDGTITSETYTVHDLWGKDDSPRNASFWFGNTEHFTHTDLMLHVDDPKPGIVPDGGEWYIARGDNMGWGRAQTAEGAVRNMRRQGKVSAYVVHRCSKWTTVDGMGSLTYPSGIDPVEVKRVGKKEKA